ncbi:MAG TPA: hypothetical protein VK977_09425 [Actinomycetota bacterium]|nr:hypothetical protein [Actinomycetota bacterium]
MTGVPDEEGFVAPAGVERHAQRHRWTRGPWLLRACRIAPLALTVALTVIATSLEPAPPSQRPRVVLDESAIRLVSHNDPIPSGADPLYPLNHTVDGKTESLGAPPNSGFEQAGGPVGTPPTNYDLQTAPIDSVTVPIGDFETGTFANWSLTGSPTISSDQTRGQIFP